MAYKYRITRKMPSGGDIHSMALHQSPIAVIHVTNVIDGVKKATETHLARVTSPGALTGVNSYLDMRKPTS